MLFTVICELCVRFVHLFCRLSCKQERTKQELDLESQRLEHQRKIDQIKAADQVQQQRMVHEEHMRQIKEKQENDANNLKR